MQKSQAVAKLPDLGLPSKEKLKAVATGTEGKNDLALNLAPKHGKLCPSMVTNEQTTHTNNIRNADLKANGRIRTVNPWFTKPELYR